MSRNKVVSAAPSKTADQLTCGEQAMTDPKIVIIEDDPDMIELLSLILRRGGYKPYPALGGKAGLRLLQEIDADLILLDLMMEDMNGWSVLEALKSDKKLCTIPVLIVSARHHLEDPVQTSAHAGQFEGYLVKPFVVHDLLTQIQGAIE
jgi:two-component system OmpR family response regulator